MKQQTKDAPSLDLHNAILDDMNNLCGANLTDANLKDAKLVNANLSKAILIKANLANAKLCWALLSGAKLVDANLSGADLRWADLTNARLFCAGLSGAKLVGADLSGVNLRDVNLRNVDLSGTKLKGCLLPTVVVANLKGCEIEVDKIRLVKRPNDDNPPGVLGLSIPEAWNVDSLDRHLNHINNEQGSLLTTIDSIDDNRTKVRLTIALIKSLGNTDVSTVALPMLSILGKSPYIKHAGIATWLDKVGLAYLKKYNEAVMPPLSETDFNFFTGMFSRHQELKFTANAAFIQFVAQAVTAGGDNRLKAIALYESYLEDERIKPYVNQDDFGDYASYKADWSNKRAMNFILLSAQENSESVMMLSLHTLNGMLQPDSDNPVWDQFFMYEKQENLSLSEYSTEALFEHDFPLFFSTYSFAKNASQFKQLLRVIDLGELQSAFEAAIQDPKSEKKLVDPVSQQTLKEIFSLHLNYSIKTGRHSLKETHYQALLQAYDLSSVDHRLAKTLLSLAALFTRFSSSAIFGTEEDSPEMLRNYAYALMEKAYALDPTIFISKEEKIGEVVEETDQYKNWTNRLLGLEDAFSCSAVLSTIEFFPNPTNPIHSYKFRQLN